MAELRAGVHLAGVRAIGMGAELSLVTVVLLVGPGIALLLDRPSRVLETVRTGFLIPMVLPPIVVALIWKVIYTRRSARSIAWRHFLASRSIR